MVEWFSIGAEAINTVGNQLLAKQQFERQKKLMEIQNKNQQEMMTVQQQNQMALNEQGQQIQLDTWEKTNYPAQMEMLRKAGLNPSLMYAKGGAGGTTGGQGGGSAASGSAASGSASMAQPMNIANILQMRTMEAQALALKADARLKNADAKLKEDWGGGTAEADIASKGAQKGSYEADKALKEVEAEGRRIDNIYKPQLLENAVSQQAQDLVRMRRENTIGQETLDNEIKLLNNRAVQQSLEIEATKAKIKLTKMEIKEISTELVQRWTELAQRATGLSQEQQRIEIEKFKAEMQNKFPSVMNVAGGFLQGALNQLEAIGRYYNPQVFDYATKKPK